LRIALLSMIEPSADGAHATRVARARLSVGGIAVARHQLALALALGVERVVCITAPADPVLTTLQHAAERVGASFHRISGLHGLLGLVTANDEVIALADGLLAWPDVAVDLLGEGHAVLTQPVESGMAMGFERLDINNASAGAMRVPGHLVERMAGLPGDCDVFATLQRVALQAGVPQRPLPDDVLGAPHWLLVRSDAEAHGIEPGWIAAHTALPRHAGPSAMLAGLGVRWLGPALLHAGTHGTVVAAAALVMSLLALMLGWFGYPVLGLGAAALAWVWFCSAALFGRVERNALRLPRPRVAPVASYAWIMDVTLLLLLTWNPQGNAGMAGLWHRAFSPLMLLGLMRLVPQIVGGGWSPWLRDRAVLALLLTGAAMAGVLGGAVSLIALGLLVCAIVCIDRPAGPPQD